MAFSRKCGSFALKASRSVIMAYLSGQDEGVVFGQLGFLQTDTVQVLPLGELQGQLLGFGMAFLMKDVLHIGSAEGLIGGGPPEGLE